MTKFILTVLCILFITNSCSTMNLKLGPEYKGVAPEVQQIVNEYKDLAKSRHIKFFNEVTIGFKTINHDNAIGMCTYGGFWREIDIDVSYWNNASSTSDLMLVFHELTHCYCGRDHDYSNGALYPSPEELGFGTTCTTRPGFFPDGCPLSIMYPIIIDDACSLAHYDEYIDEMFNRCDPW